MAFVLFSVISSTAQNADTIRYDVSFPNIAHHEAEISVTYDHLKAGEPLEVRMSISSPGRYAYHQFGKNVYRVSAKNAQGKLLEVTRVAPETWQVKGHDGSFTLSYTLFANHADGTYAGIDPLYAHLNMPATFMWAKGLEKNPISVQYHLPDNSWKIATQMKSTGSNTFVAPDFQYFMDSPTILGDLTVKEFTIKETDGRSKLIKVVLNRGVKDDVAQNFTTMVEKVVKAEQKVYKELPDYDYGEYTFLCGYGPEFDGDGMEHRNSTMITKSRTLTAENAKDFIGTVTHEFFHCWNVERIRPAALEPFDFETANMSGELWFAEGFTSYYTELSIARANICDDKEFGERLARALNYVLNSGGTEISSPVEMSRQAPFVDAATSVDPTSFYNTFTSYYPYGEVVGLALDLELRNRFKDITLDDLMHAMWLKFGKPFKPYHNDDIMNALAELTKDKAFAEEFFNKYVYGTQVPDYKTLLKTMGYDLIQPDAAKASLGNVRFSFSDGMQVSSQPSRRTALYKAGLDVQDVVIALDDKALSSQQELDSWLAQHKPGDIVKMKYSHFGEEEETKLTLQGGPAYDVVLIDDAKKKVVAKRDAWLFNE